MWITHLGHPQPQRGHRTSSAAGAGARPRHKRRQTPWDRARRPAWGARGGFKRGPASCRCRADRRTPRRGAGRVAGPAACYLQALQGDEPETPAGEASEARRPTARGRRTPRAGRKASAWRFYRALGGPAAWASRSFRHVVPRSPCPAGHGEQGRRLPGSSTKTLDGRLKLETPTNSVRGHRRSRDGSAWEAGGGCRM